MANETSDSGTRTARVKNAAGTTSAEPATKAGAPSASASAEPATKAGAPSASASTESTKEKAKAAASDAKFKVKDEALGLKDKAISSARSAARDGKGKAVEKVGGVSRALEASAAKLDEDVGKTYGDFARTAARSIDDFAAGIDGKDIDELFDDAKRFIRKSPAIAIGIAAALGFAASRVVKSGLELDDDV